jgi:hypothetical protein
MEVVISNGLNFKTLNDPKELTDAIISGKFSRDAIVAAANNLFCIGVIQDKSLYEINLLEEAYGAGGNKPVDKDTPTAVIFNKKSWDEKYLYMLYAVIQLLKYKSLYLHFDEVCRYIVKKRERKIFGQNILLTAVYSLLVISPIIILSIISKTLTNGNGGNDTGSTIE